MTSHPRRLLASSGPRWATQFSCYNAAFHSNIGSSFKSQNSFLKCKAFVERQLDISSELKRISGNLGLKQTLSLSTSGVPYPKRIYQIKVDNARQPIVRRQLSLFWQCHCTEFVLKSWQSLRWLRSSVCFEGNKGFYCIKNKHLVVNILSHINTLHPTTNFFFAIQFSIKLLSYLTHVCTKRHKKNYLWSSSMHS